MASFSAIIANAISSAIPTKAADVTPYYIFAPRKPWSLWRAMNTFANDEIAEYLGQRARREPSLGPRQQLIYSLVKNPGPNATHELEYFASTDPEPSLRAIAMARISEVSDRPELEFFRGQSNDKLEFIRLAAYQELAKLGDRSGREFALQVLRRGPPKVSRVLHDQVAYYAEMNREYAAQILGYIADRADFETLKAMSTSSSESKSTQCSAALAYQTSQWLHVPADKRLDYLINELDDDSGPYTHLWVYSNLFQYKAPNVGLRLGKFSKEPGHTASGYALAAKILWDRY